MKNFELTPQEIRQLRVAHRMEKHKKSAYKINAVILLGTGWTLRQVCEALLLDEETLSSYVRKYKDGGIEELLQTLHKGSEAKLNAEQTSVLCEELEENIHLTTLSVRAFVKEKFGVDYSQSGMIVLLHRLGFTYKKPKLIPAKNDVEAKDAFLEHYVEFMKKKPPDELVFFLDGVHPQHNSIAGYGWIRKGKDKEIRSNSGRSRLNIHGAMNAETYETTVVVSEDNIDDSSTIEILKQLLQLYPIAKKIHVILDNAKYHYSKRVLDFVDSSRINLVFLPPYSPKLNMIERLWKVFKRNVLHNRYYEKFAQFEQSCLDFFAAQDQHFDQISSIMGDGLEGLVSG